MGFIIFLYSTHRDSIEKDTLMVSPVLSSTHRDPICEKDSMNTEATALIPYDVQGPTTEVLSIIKRVVYLTLEKKYKAENVNLLLWIKTATTVSKISYWRNGSATN